MPEYLAPGVYVEEVDTGPKPIEGVSTSTSGMVGVTERGPEKVATLVTGFGEFRRLFGGYLNYGKEKAYKNNDAWYLPPAVDGFFRNGGKRLYVVRILPAAATPSATFLADRALPASVMGVLMKKATAGTNEVTVVKKIIEKTVKEDPTTNEVTLTEPLGETLQVDTKVRIKGQEVIRKLTAVSAVATTDKATLDNVIGIKKDTTLEFLVELTAADVRKDMLFKLDDGQFAEYVRVAENATDEKVKLEKPLYHDHVIGANFKERKALLKVQAIDHGAWGNTLRVTSDDDDSLLETIVAADAPKDQPQVTLSTTQGAEPGSVIDFYVQRSVSERTVVTGVLGMNIPPGTRVRLKGTDWETTVIKEAKSADAEIVLESVERVKKDDTLELLLDPIVKTTVSSIKVSLDDELNQALKTTDTVTVYVKGSRVDTVLTANMDDTKRNVVNIASGAGVEPGATLAFVLLREKVASTNGKVVTVDGTLGPLDNGVKAGWRVRTREFKLRVDCIQVNPLTGQSRVLMTETFRQLSMDPRHSRYVVKVIGRIPNGDIPLRADGRTEGEADLIRVEDAVKNEADQKKIRLGPELVIGSAPVGMWLTGGNDQIATLADQDYIGQDGVNPQERTGLFALKNIEEVSIVAIPGRTNQRVQEAVINHCELMRYRCAVLDSRRDDGMAEVQEHRGLYDTKYAALYYPWLSIADPFPENPQAQGTVFIPPSGHVMGIYARSDIERGVHKAPANEVIRGISDLEVKLMKEHQDILNPRNINVLRNFRENNRGLRVWGARVLSSDPDWKYVNVRRLFIFIEHSIDRGTQWVVFEPNNEALWERVRRVISSFLTLVWKDGALMGRTREEAYYVKCDRTTMTQNDIDNGRLIVEIGIAPVKPAEFVIFRIGQWTGGSSLEEG